MELYRLYDSFKVLPRAGGLLDQELHELSMIQALSTVVALYDMSLSDLFEQGLLDERDQAIDYATRLQTILWPTEAQVSSPS